MQPHNKIATSAFVKGSKHNEIIAKMNRFARSAEPFVFAIDFEGADGFVYSPAEAEKLGIRYNFEGLSQEKEKSDKPILRFHVSPVDFSTYQRAFDQAMAHLQRGDTYLINLTFPTPVHVSATPEELYEISRAPYKLYFPGQFVVFSPEMFVHIQGRTISSFPMKGTIDASLPDACDRLLGDEKEFFEHNTIVDLIRNDLSMVSTQVEVKRFRFLEMVRTNRGDLWQMSSEISGILPEDYLSHLGDVVFKLLPAGSVTGAPKEKTVRIIRNTEIYQRGFYTGIFGFFNGKSLISAVSIRFLEINGNNIRRIFTATRGMVKDNPDLDFPGLVPMVFKSGGGITAKSDVNSEYREMLQKVYVPFV